MMMTAPIISVPDAAMGRFYRQYITTASAVTWAHILFRARRGQSFEAMINGSKTRSWQSFAQNTQSIYYFAI